MSNINGFDIQNGVLGTYKGNDEDVVVPDGVGNKNSCLLEM